LEDFSGAAASAWLAAFGATDVATSATAPRTLKQVLDWALALGAAAGRTRDAVRVVAEIERRLLALARNLEIDRRTETVAGASMPRLAIVSSVQPAELMLPGRWVPGLAAAAGVRTVGVYEGDPDVRLGVRALQALAPEIVLLAPADASAAAATQAREFLADGDWRLAVMDGRRYIHLPGPELARSIELIAFLAHGDRSGVTPRPGEVEVWNANRAE
jgi:ABC-type Fe3+-hydroxamate transport system substrate-binding protein